MESGRKQSTEVGGAVSTGLTLPLLVMSVTAGLSPCGLQGLERVTDTRSRGHPLRMRIP